MASLKLGLLEVLKLPVFFNDKALTQKLFADIQFEASEADNATSWLVFHNCCCSIVGYPPILQF